MKVSILALLLSIALNSSAQLTPQLGIVTVKNDMPYGQWFTFRGGKNFENKVCFFDNQAHTEIVLLDLLEPWFLDMEDGEVDETGDLYWVVDNGNGYFATVYLNKVSDENSMIYIVVD
jgi:hypothetical protein